MRKEKIMKMLADILFSFILAGELAVLVDIGCVLCGKPLSALCFLAMAGVLFLLVWLVPVFGGKVRKGMACGIGLVALLCFLGWYGVSQNVVYQSVDEGKARLYGDHKVLLLVPHQDDEINVLGGVMEEYVKYGSEVYVLFSTNGDYEGLSETRFREALDVLASVGIPESHAIFLGYGDQWDPNGPHLYNAQPGKVMTSAFGRTETYAASVHPVWREGISYTIDHFLDDIESVILEYRPDIIYCVDYDHHIDHRALSLSFEKVMGRILHENADYRPAVFKGYAYGTAWEAVDDFYAENLLMTQNPFEEPYLQQPEVYRWEERVRLPVAAGGLSRSLVTAPQFQLLSLHESQKVLFPSGRVINSDKVFWKRDTESLCYEAEIRVSSGLPEALCDFMLLDSGDLVESGQTPFDGVWVPDVSDLEKQITVSFPEPVDIENIVLYDHPDPEKNVVNAKISFEDGTVYETGSLHPGGAATRISIQRQQVASFTVTLTECQGEAGLTEVEVLEKTAEAVAPYIKLMDEDGNFAYDYWIDPSGEQRFLLYSGDLAISGQNGYTVSCSNAACSAVWEEGTICVTVPSGEECVVTVASEDGALSDSAVFRNPGKMERAWTNLWIRVEKKVYELCKTEFIHERLFICRLYSKVAAVAKRIF